MAEAEDYDFYDEIEYSMSLVERVGKGAWTVPCRSRTILLFGAQASDEEAYYRLCLYDHIWDEPFFANFREEGQDW